MLELVNFNGFVYLQEWRSYSAVNGHKGSFTRGDFLKRLQKVDVRSRVSNLTIFRICTGE